MNTKTGITLFLREWRQHRGLSQEELAARMDYDRTGLSRIETGRMRWNDVFLANAAAALQCRPVDLLTRDPFSGKIDADSIDQSGDLPGDAGSSTNAGRRPLITYVPQPAASPSAGYGSSLTSDEIVAYWPFSKEWLRAQGFGGNLAALILRGDSMEPTLLNGSLVLIDLDDHNPAIPGIYCVYDDALLVKRLARIGPNQLQISSDNAAYATYTRPLSEMRIIGRVIWTGRKL